MQLTLFINYFVSPNGDASGTKTNISKNDPGTEAANQQAAILVRQRIKGCWIKATAS
jgi:hypothetical protein